MNCLVNLPQFWTRPAVFWKTPVLPWIRTTLAGAMIPRFVQVLFINFVAKTVLKGFVYNILTFCLIHWLGLFPSILQFIKLLALHN